MLVVMTGADQGGITRDAALSFVGEGTGEGLRNVLVKLVIGCVGLTA
jgi:hypothetical protein